MRIKLIIILLFSNLVHSQLSNKHWIPPLYTTYSNSIEQYLYLSTPEQTPFTIKITNGQGVEISGSPFTISNGNPRTIIIGNQNPSLLFEDNANAFANDKGLILEAKKDFYVSVRLVLNDNSEVIVSKGRDALGTHFKLGSLPQSRVSNDGNFVVGVMAKENGTIVTISNYNTDVIFHTIVGPISPNSQTILLNEGYSVTFTGYSSQLPNLDGFVGATLTSNKPVAVITGNILGNMSTANTGHDINLDQIVPVEQVGTEYVLIKGNGSDNSERPLAIATQDNTNIFINGNTIPSFTINEGEYALIPSSNYQGTENQNMYISSDKPVYMYQITAGSSSDGSTGFSFIPPLSCFFKKKIDLVPNIGKIGNYQFNTDILAVTSTNSVVKINGITTSFLPEPVLGNPDWVTYRIPGYFNNVVIESTGPIAAGVIGSDNANSGFSSYYSGFGDKPKNSSVIVCSEGLTNLLEEVDGNPETGGVWTPALASGTDIFNPDVDLATVYNYYQISNCDIVDVNVSVTIQQAPFAGNDTSIVLCDKDNITDLRELLGDNIEPNGYWLPELASGTNYYSAQNDGSGQFTYFIDDNYICESSASVTVTVNPSPVFNGNPITDFVICDTNEDGDDANGFATFNLSIKTTEILTGQPNTVQAYYYETKQNADTDTNPLTNYYSNSKDIFVKLVDTNTNCFSLAKLSLIVRPLPLIVNTIELNQCDVDSDGITDFNLTQANDLITSESNVSFAYFTSLNNAQNNILPITNFDNFSSSSNTEIWAKITNEFGCSKISKITLLVSSTQIPANYNFQIIECDTFIDSNDPATDGITYFNFSNATVAILGQLPSSQNLNIYYYQNQQDAILEQNQISNLTNYRNTNSPFSQNIWVRIESTVNNECVGLGPYLTLTVNPSPYFDLGDDIIVCVDPVTGQNNSQITLNATPSIQGNYNFQWSPTNPNIDSNGNQSPIFNNAVEGIYSVIVTDNSTNCTSSDSVQVIYSSAPQNVVVNLTTPLFSAGTSSILVTVENGYGNYEFSIDNGENWQVSPVFIGLPNGIYTIHVRDVAQCGLVVSESIRTITYPSYFTPNGDGFNEYWNINNLPQNYNAIITIYDRYGKLLKQIKPNQASWDGSFNGYLLPSTDYWFKIEYTENGSRKEFKSHFALKR
ncbi:T9SS type B sorting domain-containing protein [uncultured Flavobacterium sp.]|uniref:T9SS type B sorting domain-containing protein n=1 Tax=uncultured Flavobacterium sp. TaxID=165435 RepID=UPI0030C7A160